MASHRFSLLAALVGALVLPASVTTATASTPWHARLLRSQPAAQDSLSTSPTAIRLWFSEPIELGVSRVRLMDPAGAPVALGKVSRIAGENAQAMMAAVGQRLKPGTYRVRWTSAAQDGHAMKGEFSFVILPGK